MKPMAIPRMLIVSVFAAAMVTALWSASDRIIARLSVRLTNRYRQSLAELSDEEAARLIRRLAHSNAQWLEVLVTASGDDRPDVAQTATAELLDLVARWQTLPPEENAVWLAELARLLARHAPALPAQRRHLPFSLAQQLIEWPVDSRRIDAAQFIADCESVLVLPRSDEPEIRLAAVPRPAAIVPPRQPSSASGRMSLSDE